MYLSNFERELVNVGRNTHCIEKIRNYLCDIDMCKVQDALTLGCGCGELSAFLAETYNMRVHGTDHNSNKIERARQQYFESDNVLFHIEDATDLHFGEDSFDLIIAQNVFHRTPHWKMISKETARVLRKGGVMIWQDLAVNVFARQLLWPLSKTIGLFTIAEIRAAFSRNGLEFQFHERKPRGLFTYHEVVMQKL